MRMFTNPNSNYLTGMECPRCGATEGFWIDCTIYCLVNDDGVKEYGDTNWSQDDECKCSTCQHFATVRDFGGTST